MSRLTTTRLPALRVLTGPAARAEWERIAAALPLSVGRTPVWSDFVCASGRFVPATRAYRTADGRTLVLPLVRRRGTPTTLGLHEGWPFGWDAGIDGNGLVTDGPVTPEDVAAVAADLAALPAARVRLTPGLADAPAWEAAALPGWRRSTETVHIVDLPAAGGPPFLQGLSHNATRKLRKAERSFEVECDDTGRLLPVFEQLHRRSVDGWAAQHWLPTAAARRLLLYRDPPRRRVDLARRLDGGLRVWVARDAGEPVGAIVVLSAGPTAVYWGGATDKALARNRGVGQLVHARALECAVAEGRAHYDMGSSGSADLAAFKQTMGGRPVDQVSWSFERVPVTAAEAAARGALRAAATGAAAARRALLSRGASAAPPPA